MKLFRLWPRSELRDPPSDPVSGWCWFRVVLVLGSACIMMLSHASSGSGAPVLVPAVW